MGKRIEYVKGEVVGCCEFIKDVESKRKPNGSPVRFGLFKCGFCGSEFKSSMDMIKGRRTRSCGCLNGKKPNHKPQQHGLRKSDAYWRWVNIKRRCLLESNESYHNYGGRGIALHKPWVNDFKAFHNYVIALPNYGKPGMTLDRKENDGNYEPGNLRWVSYSIQVINQRMMRTNTSGYIGVSKSHKRWISSISVDGKRYALGRFNTKKEAAKARNDFIISNNLENHPLNKI